MIFTVSSAAAPLRSTQNTCAPSRAKVTAVALPLPQPGPIEPAPTTIATLPLSRSIAFLPCCCSGSPDGAKRNPGTAAPDCSSPPSRCGSLHPSPPLRTNDRPYLLKVVTDYLPNPRNDIRESFGFRTRLGWPNVDGH